MTAPASAARHAVNWAAAAESPDPILFLRRWAWVTMARGIVSILFTAAAFAVPGTGLSEQAALFGAYAFLMGVLAGYAGMTVASGQYAWLEMLFEGSLGIAAGVIAILAPGLTAASLTYLIGGWAILRGGLEIATASALRQLVPSERAIAVSGMLSITVGFLLFASPGAGLLTWLWIVGFYAIPCSMLMISLGFRLRNLATATG
jgi:uncharacterized membrane protein HdeD (DUF308 family)